MLNIPIVRWGKPYDSLETDEVRHFATVKPIATVSQANGGIIQRDLKKVRQARDTLKQFRCHEIIEMMKQAHDL